MSNIYKISESLSTSTGIALEPIYELNFSSEGSSYTDAYSSYDIITQLSDTDAPMQTIFNRRYPILLFDLSFQGEFTFNSDSSTFYILLGSNGTNVSGFTLWKSHVSATTSQISTTQHIQYMAELTDSYISIPDNSTLSSFNQLTYINGNDDSYMYFTTSTRYLKTVYQQCNYNISGSFRIYGIQFTL